MITNKRVKQRAIDVAGVMLGKTICVVSAIIPLVNDWCGWCMSTPIRCKAATNCETGLATDVSYDITLENQSIH